MKELLVIAGGNAFQPTPHENIIGAIEWTGNHFVDHGETSGFMVYLESAQFQEQIKNREVASPLKFFMEGSTSLQARGDYYSEEDDGEDFEAIRNETLQLLS